MTIQFELPDRPLRLLHVEDDQEDNLILRDLLAEIEDISFEMDWVSTYDEGYEKLVENVHDLCLLDFRLGAYDGLELFRAARDAESTVPVVIVTGSGTRLVDMKAMYSGIDYYIEKQGLNAFDLERAIRYTMRHAFVMDTLKTLNNSLEERVEERTKLLREAKEQLESEIEERITVENELRVLRAERQRMTLEQIASHPRTRVTAQSLGMRSFSEADPERFDQLVRRYGNVLDLVMDQLVYKVNHEVSDEMRTLASTLGALRLGPRDLVDIHNTVLQIKADSVSLERAEGYIDEGRLMVLEIMGYLASYYRKLASGKHRE